MNKIKHEIREHYLQKLNISDKVALVMFYVAVLLYSFVVYHRSSYILIRDSCLIVLLVNKCTSFKHLARFLKKPPNWFF